MDFQIALHAKKSLIVTQITTLDARSLKKLDRMSYMRQQLQIFWVLI